MPLLEDEVEGAKELMDMPFTPLSLLANKDVPEDVLETLREAAKRAVESEEWKNYIASSGQETLYTEYSTVEEMKSFFSSFESRMSWLLYEAGVTESSPEEFSIPRP